jgi:hypothetical protein
MTQPQQLGFGFDEILREQETAHLPGTMEEAIPYYRKLIEKHHHAMMTVDFAAAMKVREEADELAIKLNGGALLGIKGGPDAPCYVLERATAAPTGTVPMWGQTGDYVIDVDGMRVRIEQEGMYGIGAFMSPTPGFSAHAVDYDKPFLSETGYQSFAGFRSEPEPGMTPDVLAAETIRAKIQRDSKGKLRKIERSYVEPEMERRARKQEQVPEHSQ